MKDPQISVIMAVKDGMPYVKDAVKSILDQTYKDFEFIVVDDLSTDGTAKYLETIKDKRVKLIKNKKNLGLAASLNKALKVANGTYIARMDADDISLPKRLAKQLEFLEKNPQIDLCGTWAHLIDETSKIIGEKKFPTEDKMIKKMLAIYSSIIHPTFFAKKDFFQKVGGYDTKYEYVEDYELLLRAKKNFQFANLPHKLFKWRLWNGRRSRADMEKIDRADFKVKLDVFKRGDFGPLYTILIARKFLATYFLPRSLKLKLSKVLKLA